MQAYQQQQQQHWEGGGVVMIAGQRGEATDRASERFIDISRHVDQATRPGQANE